MGIVQRFRSLVGTHGGSWVRVAALAGIYFAAARLGLTMAFVADQVTVVWPPTGIALAAVLLLGYRVWPGITLGAFLANATTGAGPGASLLIAAGNTLEALTGAWLLRRLLDFDPSLGRLKDALGLVFLAALTSTTVSATVGVTSLCLWKVESWSRFGPLWRVWWLGDAVGALVVAPLLLTLVDAFRARPRGGWKRLPEAVLLFSLLGLVGIVVLAGGLGRAFAHPTHEYAVFPFVIWAAFRFGRLGTSLVTFVTSSMAIWGTLNGLGPFAADSVHESLILLQSYVAVLAVTGLVLSTAIHERNIAERRRTADYAVTQVLAESSTLAGAAPGILRAICKSLGWDLGAVWTIDPKAGVLRCIELWHSPSTRVPMFVKTTRERTFDRGIGLPGRVWASGRPAWIADVVEDSNFPRAPVASSEGLHGAFGIPLVFGKQVHGVMEFFSREIRRPDPDLLQMMGAIGSQIGQFIERKRTELELRRSEHELADFFENAVIGLHWAGPDGIILRVNQAELDLLGYTRDEYIGRPIAEFHADKDVIEDILTRLRRGETLRDFEARLLRKDGSIVDVLIDSSVLWEDGSFVHTRSFTRDITERKRAEEALKEADRRKDEFLATLAHELRNPLAPIRHGVQVLRMTGAAPTAERIHVMMERQVGHMVRLVDDLMEVSRITRGDIELRKEPVLLAAVIESALETSRPVIDASRHELSIHVMCERLVVEADPIRLAQVVANLLNNAAKYTEPGGRIELEARREDGFAVISVRDTGIGIPPEILPWVFEMFTQAKRGRAQGGLGIGLTLVKRLVQMHGGTVEARSEGPGRGSEFTVRLPLSGGTLDLDSSPPR